MHSNHPPMSVRIDLFDPDFEFRATGEDGVLFVLHGPVILGKSLLFSLSPYVLVMLLFLEL